MWRVPGLWALCCALLLSGASSAQTGASAELTAADRAALLSVQREQQLAARAVDGGFSAPHPGQRWTTHFDGRGFRTEPDDASWTWGLDLLEYGFPGLERTPVHPLRVAADGRRVSYEWDAVLTEWYVNDAHGLEHGYTLRQRPLGLNEDEDEDEDEPLHPDRGLGRDGSGHAFGPLTLRLAVRGGLRPVIDADGRGVRFVGESGAAALTYSGLTVFDVDGQRLAARFERVAAGLALTIDEQRARYPLTIDPIAQQAYLKASNTGADDFFGDAVAVSGDTVVVGAPREASAAPGVNGNQKDDSLAGAGAVYVFVRNGSSWTQQAYLKASNPGLFDSFGSAVAIDGDVLVVGARTEDSDARGVNGDGGNDLAHDSGAVYAFVRSGNTWVQEAYLKASNADAEDTFGSAVALSGDTLLVTARCESSRATGADGDQADNGATWSGAAYVFVREQGVWSQQAYLKASNTEALDSFGRCVAVWGDSAVIGANSESSSATGVDGDQADNASAQAGAAYVFVRRGTSWSQQAYLKASNTGVSDRFGESVAISGDSLVVGALLEQSRATGVQGDQSDNGAPNSGAAYVFTRNRSVWSQQAYVKASNTGQHDQFGYGIAISGDTLAVGAFGEDSSAHGVNGDQGDNSASAAGAVYVFARSGTSWSQQAYLKASNPEEGDLFGVALALSDTDLVVGASSEDGNATGVNGIQGNGPPDSGAAYVFPLPGAECFLVIGDQPGAAPFLEIDHLFQTQVGPDVQGSYVVLLEAIPEFVLPAAGKAAVSGLMGKAPGKQILKSPPDASPPRWMLDGQFAVQVVMWNPVVFPGQPEQCSAGLYVTILPHGGVHVVPYGTPQGGMQIWHQVGTNAAGQQVIRFPFSISGL